LDCSAAGAALEHRQVLRYQDPSSNYCELLYPLAAEGKPVGVLRVRLPDQSAQGAATCGGGRDIADIEEILNECARHVALALKKEADVDRAEIDGLTGLLMKREFEPRLTEALQAGHEEKRPVALLVTDIDHFKSVNDTHGHRTGDIILRGVASIMRRHVRSCDAAFRYGGEELCVMLPGSGVREAKATAERLREAVEAAVFTGDRGQDVRVTISIGLAAYDPKRAKASAEKARDPAELFRRADNAVYAAKEGGRNRVIAWGSRSKGKTATKSSASSTRTRAKTEAKPRKSMRRAKLSTKTVETTTASGRTLRAEFNPDTASSQVRRSA
jgi:diguanylate cyclase (GGDEF)-like protein